MQRSPARPLLLVSLGVVLLLAGSWWGLAKAPAEVFMGDVQRIMYVHVPTAWNAMLVLTFSFVCAVCFLLTNAWKWVHQNHIRLGLSHNFRCDDIAVLYTVINFRFGEAFLLNARYI